MKKSKHIGLVALSLLIFTLCACNNNAFRINGHVTGYEGETLFLEYLGLTKTEVLDSVILPASGKFHFRQQRPEYPDLFRLRIDNASLILAIDSTEQISIEADSKLPEATIQNSPKSDQIRELRRSLRDKPLEEHKDFAGKMILQDPRSMVAYYALFQQKAGLPVFDIFSKEDRVFFSAVATSFNTWMPKYNRTKILYGQVIDVINGERREQNLAMMRAFIDESESTFLDISLPDENNETQALSQYKGKLTVVSFATTRMEKYTGFVFEMKDVYNTYHSRGLEIYEVYVDPSKILWEEQVRALPWTTVYTEDGTDDQVFMRFNIRQIPTFFLYNRKGEIVGRFADFDSLKKAIEKEL